MPNQAVNAESTVKREDVKASQEPSSVFAFKSSMEHSHETRSCRKSAASDGTSAEVDEGDAETEDEHCRRLMDFQGDTTLIKMAFGGAVLASRVQRDGAMDLLLRR